MRPLALLPVCAAVATLAGCGGGGSPAGPAQAEPTPTTQGAEVPTVAGKAGKAETSYTIEAAPNGAPRFSVRLLKVPVGSVQLVLVNASRTPHDIVVSGHGVHARGSVVTAKGGQPGRSVVTVDVRAGRYAFYSDVGADRASGMHGVLLVGALH